MSIFVTTPTGHIGSRITENLLNAGKEVTIFVRDAGKVAHFAKRGAKVLQGDLENMEAVVAATKGATALFWLTPPKMVETGFRAYQNRLGRIAAEAISRNGIPYVVHQSSVGAQKGEGAGPVNGLADIEKLLNETSANVTHLRAAFFMENFLNSVKTIKESGSIFMPVAGNTRLATVATRDIGDVATRLLTERNWTGKRAVHLFGPAELTFDGAAEILSKGSGKKVLHVAVTPDQAKAAMTGMGLSAEMAGLYVELYQAAETGLLYDGVGGPDLRGAVTFEDFARETILPALK